MTQDTIVIGILGGIASGKSTVARQFEKLGCAVIQADPLAHQVLQLDAVKTQIVDLFGSRILDPTGRVDRKTLAGIVFQDAGALQRLNALIHPRVMAAVEEKIAHFRQNSSTKAIILDVPLLAEVGRLDLCDVLVFVQADPSVRRRRLKNSGKFNENELKIRENFQISLDKKKNLAHYILCNNSDESDMAGQVAQLFSIITGNR